MFRSKAVWATGVRTVPARAELLRHTLASLRTGGFDPQVFLDTGKGAFGNFVDMLRELIRDPKVDRIATFEDDIACVGNLCHNPSLLQHTGETSSIIQAGIQNISTIRSLDFPGENFDALSLLNHSLTKETHVSV